MIQAGIHKITLYENKNLVVNYEVFTIETGGEIIILDNEPKIIINPQAVNINFVIAAQLNDLNQPSVDIVNDSVYGWIAKIDFQDLTTKIIDKPFFDERLTEINSNVSNSRNLNLKAWSKLGLIPFN